MKNKYANCKIMQINKKNLKLNNNKTAHFILIKVKITLIINNNIIKEINNNIKIKTKTNNNNTNLKIIYLIIVNIRNKKKKNSIKIS